MNNNNNPRPLLEKAYGELLKNDSFLLQNDVNERTITHRLAIYLEKYFPEYHIDCEYNRNGSGIAPKSLEGLKRKIAETEIQKKPEDYIDDTSAMTVYPDIIIHKRGLQEGFIVIEAKKSTNFAGYDHEKLELYKTELGYQHAYFVTFPIRNESSAPLIYADLIKEI